LKPKLRNKGPFILTAQKGSNQSKNINLAFLPLRDMNEIVNRQHSNSFALQVAFARAKGQK
jgi:hypothetical protein